MKDFLRLLQWDMILFNRNRLFGLAFVLALIYMGVFFLLRSMGNLSTILTVLIFNDPVVTGYLFAGILLLFDKNQNTLQAIQVLPIPFHYYLLSKIILLSVLATLLAVMMTLATQVQVFHWAHLVLATFLSAFLFSCVGFAIGALSKNFNQLLFYSIPLLILGGLPLLSLFGFGKATYFMFLPSTGGIGILAASFREANDFYEVLLFYIHLLGCTVISWVISTKIIRRQLV